MSKFTAEQGRALSYFSSQTGNRYPLGDLFSATFFEMLCFFFFLMILSFKMTAKCTSEVLPSIPKCKKAVVCLMEKIHVLD